MNLQFKTRYQYRSIMDMTPLIDFAFSLLIYFMMTYHADAGKLSSISINLPSADKVQDIRDSTITVSINEHNEVYINDTKYPLNAVPDEFMKIKSRHPQGMVVIRGDKKTNYDTVIKVMDDLNKAGIKKFTLAAIKS